MPYFEVETALADDKPIIEVELIDAISGKLLEVEEVQQ